MAAVTTSLPYGDRPAGYRRRADHLGGPFAVYFAGLVPSVSDAVCLAPLVVT